MRGDAIVLLIRYEGEQVEDEMGGACGTYGEAIYVLCILHVHTIKGLSSAVVWCILILV
jgi:hypothetical protein